MEKKSWAILLIVLLAFVVGVFLIASYYYNNHVFQVVGVCISKEIVDSKFPCENREVCVEIVRNESEELDGLMNQQVDFLQAGIATIINKSIYCQETCKVRQMRIIEDYDLENSCSENEEAITFDVHGKEALELLSIQDF